MDPSYPPVQLYIILAIGTTFYSFLLSNRLAGDEELPKYAGWLLFSTWCPLYLYIAAYAIWLLFGYRDLPYQDEPNWHIMITKNMILASHAAGAFAFHVWLVLANRVVAKKSNKPCDGQIETPDS